MQKKEIIGIAMIVSIFILFGLGIGFLIQFSNPGTTVTPVLFPYNGHSISIPNSIHNKDTAIPSHVYSSTNSGVTISARLGNDTISNSDQLGYLLLELSAKNNLDAGINSDLPLNIAFVIDRSGSMQGEKLDNVKKALLLASNYLNGNDVVSIVSYDSEVYTFRAD
jgi:hypothetical protein